MPIQVIDDFLDTEDFNRLHLYLTSADVNWNLGPILNDIDEDSSAGEINHQLARIFYSMYAPSSDATNVWPLVKKLKTHSVLRIKANLTFKNELQVPFFHTDYSTDVLKPYWKTAVYYVNTNNGHTLFEDGTKVESVENRIVIFDTSTRHSGIHCTDEPYRVVVNINYIE